DPPPVSGRGRRLLPARFPLLVLLLGVPAASIVRGGRRGGRGRAVLGRARGLGPLGGVRTPRLRRDLRGRGVAPVVQRRSSRCLQATHSVALGNACNRSLPIGLWHDSHTP